jgi:hypothetical protein
MTNHKLDKILKGCISFQIHYVKVKFALKCILRQTEDRKLMSFNLKFYPIYDLSFTQQSTDDIYQSYVFYA